MRESIKLEGNMDIIWGLNKKTQNPDTDEAGNMAEKVIIVRYIK